MTIHFDNGTIVEATKDIVSITNGRRGFTYDFSTRELHRACDTLQDVEIDPDIMKCINETMWAMGLFGPLYYSLEDRGQLELYGLNKEDLTQACPRHDQDEEDGEHRIETLDSMLNQVASHIGDQTLPIENLTSFLKETCPELTEYLIYEAEAIAKRSLPKDSSITTDGILTYLTMAWSNSYND